MEITIHAGSIGACNKINVDWFDENGVRKTNVIEIDVMNVDMPRMLCLKLDGKRIAVIPQLPPAWCEHISVSLLGQYCYNGIDTRQWTHCPKCGKARPSNEKGQR